MSTFQEFNLLPTLQASLDEMGLKKPTEIQSRTIPNLLAERSLVGVAETGTGKTLSYVLPILHMLKTLENKGDKIVNAASPRAVVIVPTRELGEQVTKVFKPFTHTTRLRVRSVLGGTTMEVAKKNIRGTFEILVATPGRLVKMLAHDQLNFSDVHILVFDEADQMLDQGFLQDALFIAEACPARRQMALFSATVSNQVQKLMNELFDDAEVIRSQRSHKVVPQLTTKNWEVVNGKRLPLLDDVVSKNVEGGTLVFTNTREQCDKLAVEFTKKNIPCAIYRGEMDKKERRANLKSFREGKIQYLISTDLGSRGLDIDHVGRVINYHMPQNLDNYIHRVGRTARAGRAGLVINFITERDEYMMDKIEDLK